MSEPVRKKLTITRQAVAEAKPVTPRRFIASFDATHLDLAGVAAALRALAASVEAPAKLAAQANMIRARVAALDPDLTTETRLAARDDEDRTYPIAVNGQQVGSASFAAIRALPKLTPVRVVTVGDPDEEVWEDVEEDAEEGDESEEHVYDEDEDVEYYQHDQWHPGIVIDRASLFTYIVETTHGRRLEVNVHALRRPEED